MVRADIVDIEFETFGYDGLTLRNKIGDNEYEDITYRFNSRSRKSGEKWYSNNVTMVSQIRKQYTGI